MAIKLIDFDINQTEFSSEQSKKIWHIGKHILPLEITLANITDHELREGCTQIYQAIRAILSDMYTHPDQYPCLHIDLVFSNFIRRGAILDENGYNWIIPSDVYKKYVRYHNGDFETLFQKFGFSIAETGSNTILSNEEYPLFLKYWYLTPQLSGNRSSNPSMCDFRVFAEKRYKPTFDDVLYPQSDRDKVYLKDLYEYAISIKHTYKPISSIVSFGICIKMNASWFMKIGIHTHRLSFSTIINTVKHGTRGRHSICL
jgi:hypothetical protein